MENRFKFRWFSKVRLKMFDVVCIEYPGTIIYKDENGHEIETSWSSDNGVLMQCTGLKDKFGKPIFEGDIVSFKIGANPKIALVEYDTENAEWRKGHFASLGSYKKNTQIIGNVFENLELLTVKNEKQV